MPHQEGSQKTLNKASSYTAASKTFHHILYTDVNVWAAGVRPQSRSLSTSLFFFKPIVLHRIATVFYLLRSFLYLTFTEAKCSAVASLAKSQYVGMTSGRKEKKNQSFEFLVRPTKTERDRICQRWTNTAG